MSNRLHVTGVTIGTGSAKNLIGDKVGFRPSKVEIHNLTRKVKALWLDTMPDASAELVVDSGAGTTDLSTITSNGITPLAGGFTLGSNSSMNTSGDEIHYEVWG